MKSFSARITCSVMTAVSACLLVAATAQAASFVELHGQLRVQGTKFVDESGDAVTLRGASLFWHQWEGEFWTRDVVRWLRDDWKCTVIRAAMGVESGGYLSDPNHAKQLMTTVVDACIEYGIYVIIDWHDHNAENHYTEAKAFFEEMATTYGSTPNVMYEIYNEPDEGASSWASYIKPYAESLIPDIRAIDDDGIIIVGTPNWSQDVDVAADNPITGHSNVAYTMHWYATMHKQWLRDKTRAAIDKGIAVFVTECGVGSFGSSCPGASGYDLDEANRFFDFCNQNEIGTATWSVANKDECTAFLKLNNDQQGAGGWTEDMLTTSGTFMRNYLRTQNANAFDGTPPANRITVTVQGEGAVGISPDRQEYDDGTEVTLTASPDQGYEFLTWSGDESSSENPLQLVVNSSISLTAIFVPLGGGLELLTNGDFSDNETGWGPLGVYGGAAGSFAVDNGEGVVAITNGGTEHWHIQLLQSGISLIEGQDYLLSFDGYADAPRSMHVNVGQSSSPYASYGVDQTVQLTTQQEHFAFSFTMESPADNNARLEFNLGTAGGTVYLDNVSLLLTGDTGATRASEPGERANRARPIPGRIGLAGNGLERWVLLGLDGRVVLRGNSTNAMPAVLPTAGIAAGTYLVRITTPRGVSFGRVWLGDMR